MSRVLGFIRDLIIAFALGASPWADSFFVAFRIPNLLRRLFGEGSLTMAFIPVFERTRQEKGLEEAFSLARSVFHWLLLILGLLCLLTISGAGFVTRLIAPGFADNPVCFSLTVLLVQICFPYIIFISGVALCMGILNSMGHFLAPAMAPCILNVVLISAALVGYYSQLSVPVALAFGVLLAGLLQWESQQPFLRAKGFSWKGKWSFSHQGVKRIGKLVLPSLLGAAVYQINIVLNTVLASLLPQGSISYLYYADRLTQFPLGIFGVAVSTAALPSLSSLASKDRTGDFRNTLHTTLSLTLFISLPAMAGLISLSHPLIKFLFARGAFDQHAVGATALALVGYGLGLPAFCAVRNLVSAFYALEDTRTPVFVAIICLLVNIGTGFVLMHYIAHFGLALAVSISSWINIILLGLLLQKKIGPWFAVDRELIISGLLSGLIFLGCYFTVPLGVKAVFLIPIWMVVYLGGALLCGSKGASLLLGVIYKRIKQ